MQRENDIQAPTAAEAIDEAQEVLEKIEPEQQKPEKKKRKLSPAGQTLIAMLLAIAAGLLLQSHADFSDPENLCTGFDYVFTAGEPCVEKDRWTNTGSGQALCKPYKFS